MYQKICDVGITTKLVDLQQPLELFYDALDRWPVPRFLRPHLFHEVDDLGAVLLA